MKKGTLHPPLPVIFYIPTDEVSTTVKSDRVAYEEICTMSGSLEINKRRLHVGASSVDLGLPHHPV